MPKYSFLWRVVRDRRNEDAGWHSKTVTASNDKQAYEKMLNHGGDKSAGRNVDFDYEMAREDVPYDPENHEARFWDMQKAGLSLSLW